MTESCSTNTTVVLKILLQCQAVSLAGSSTPQDQVQQSRLSSNDRRSDMAGNTVHNRSSLSSGASSSHKSPSQPLLQRQEDVDSYDQRPSRSNAAVTFELELQQQEQQEQQQEHQMQRQQKPMYQSSHQSSYPPPVVTNNVQNSVNSSRLISESKFIFPDGSLHDSLSRSGRRLESVDDGHLFSTSIRKIAEQGWGQTTVKESSNHSIGPAGVGITAGEMRATMKSAGSNAFDIDKEYKKSRRKWSLLQKLNDVQPSDIELQQVLYDINLVRPSTGSSVTSSNVDEALSRSSSRSEFSSVPTVQSSRRFHKDDGKLKRSGSLILGQTGNVWQSSDSIGPIPPPPSSSYNASMTHNTTVPWKKFEHSNGATGIGFSSGKQEMTGSWASASGGRELSEDNEDIYSEFGL